MFYHHDRDATRELAELWKPGVPVAENAAYIARSKELNTDLETAFASSQQSKEAKTAAKSRRRLGQMPEKPET